MPKSKRQLDQEIKALLRGPHARQPAREAGSPNSRPARVYEARTRANPNLHSKMDKWSFSLEEFQARNREARKQLKKSALSKLTNKKPTRIASPAGSKNLPRRNYTILPPGDYEGRLQGNVMTIRDVLDTEGTRDKFRLTSGGVQGVREFRVRVLNNKGDFNIFGINQWPSQSSWESR